MRVQRPADRVFLPVVPHGLQMPSLRPDAPRPLKPAAGVDGAACALLAARRPIVGRVTTKRAAGSRSKSAVLRAQPAKARTVERAVDMLSAKDRRALRNDLSELARIRRDAEANSASLRLS